MPIHFEHAVVEMAMHSFASEQAFGSPDCRNLWLQSESVLSRQAPGISIEQLVQLRDDLWWDNSADSEFCMAQEWRRNCHRFLANEGSFALPRVADVVQERTGIGQERMNLAARRVWRWLSFAAPADSLLVGIWESQDKRCPTMVQTVPRHLAESMQRHGFAELHLHLGAALQFPDLWSSVMRVVGQTTTKPSSFHSYGGVFRDGRGLPHWLLRTAIARLIMARYLRQQLQTAQLQDFREFICNEVLQPLSRRAGATASWTLLRALAELADGQLSFDAGSAGIPAANQTGQAVNFLDLQQVYRMLAGPQAFLTQWDTSDHRVLRSASLEQFRAADPLQRFFLDAGQVPGEMQFQFQCLEQSLVERSLIKQPPAATPGRNQHMPASLSKLTFERIFSQYFRVRNLYYRHIVCRPLMPGLPWFVRSYNRIYAGRRAMSDRALLQSAARISGQGLGLRSLEVRTTVKGRLNELRRYFDELTFEADRHIIEPWLVDSQHKLNEVGVVIHLIRNRGGSYEDGDIRPLSHGTFADPSFNRSGPFIGYRYGTFYKIIRREMFALSTILSERPELLHFIRGIDACNDEGAIPLWVIKSFMNETRELSRSLASQECFKQTMALRPLHLTIHVGEDFPHLLTGLRRIGEVLEHLQPRESDRLGHAIALGLGVTKWVDQTQRVLMSREDRMWDLAWEFQHAMRNDFMTSSSRSLFVVDQIETLARDIFGSNSSLRARDVLQLYRDLYDNGQLRSVRFPDGQGMGTPAFNASRDSHGQRRLAWLAQYLTDRDCFERCRQGVWVNVKDDQPTLESVQRWLRREVAFRGLFVEVNPSSNLLVASLGDLRHHPVANFLRKSNGDDDNSSQLRCAIGSDDPIVFASPLPDEYAWLADGLIEAGWSPEEADARLSDMRETSLQARFTYPRKSHVTNSRLD